LIDLFVAECGGMTQEGNPPWAQKVFFPPSEFEPMERDTKPWKLPDGIQVPKCTTGKGSPPLHTPELDQALDAFCVNGAKIDNFGNGWDRMFNYPPKGKPQFYDTARLKMHLVIGAAPLNGQQEKRPYYNEKACE
jgi:hypothetical protein